MQRWLRTRKNANKIARPACVLNKHRTLTQTLGCSWLGSEYSLLAASRRSSRWVARRTRAP